MKPQQPAVKPIQKPSIVEGIIFDIDGTLANSWRLGFDATQVVLKENGIPLIDEETYHQCTRYCTPDRMALHAGLEPETKQFLATGQKLGQRFDDLYVGLVSVETAGFFSGIHDLVMSIPEDIKVGALTNACAAYADAVLNCNLGSESSIKPNRFVSVRGADNVPAPKPNPDGLLLCCKDMQCDPTKCIYVGDSPTDGFAAHAAGMCSAGVLWGSHSKKNLQEAPFQTICSNVEELKAFLLKA